MYLILDTETTGISPTDRIVSICWAFFDSNAKEVVTKYYIIYPEGFVIPPNAAAIHGITTEQARQQGIPLRTALGDLSSDVVLFAPQFYVGHNVAFDIPILLNEYRRLGSAESISSLPTICTMKLGTNICQLPSARGGYKWPKLTELHHHLFGGHHNSAHDAKGDVSATAKCFFELRRRGYC